MCMTGEISLELWRTRVDPPTHIRILSSRGEMTFTERAGSLTHPPFLRSCCIPAPATVAKDGTVKVLHPCSSSAIGKADFCSVKSVANSPLAHASIPVASSLHAGFRQPTVTATVGRPYRHCRWRCCLRSCASSGRVLPCPRGLTCRCAPVVLCGIAVPAGIGAASPALALLLRALLRCLQTGPRPASADVPP